MPAISIVMYNLDSRQSMGNVRIECASYQDRLQSICFSFRCACDQILLQTRLDVYLVRVMSVWCVGMFLHMVSPMQCLSSFSKSLSLSFSFSLSQSICGRSLRHTIQFALTLLYVLYIQSIKYL